MERTRLLDNKLRCAVRAFIYGSTIQEDVMDTLFWLAKFCFKVINQFVMVGGEAMWPSGGEQVCVCVSLFQRKDFVQSEQQE